VVEGKIKNHPGWYSMLVEEVVKTIIFIKCGV
jgi:hypothetical protein